MKKSGSLKASQLSKNLSESQIQAKAVEHFRKKYPNYKLSLQASLNGIRLPTSDIKVISKIMNKAKREGMVNGQSDLFLAVPIYRDGKMVPGKYIEVKTDKGRPTEDQLYFIDEMIANGYDAEVVKGLDNLVKCLDDWMSYLDKD